MQVNSVSSAQNQNFASKVKQETNAEKTPEQIKEGKKKLALALGALAAIGAAIAGGVVLYKKGKLNGINNALKPNPNMPKFDTVVGDSSLIQQSGGKGKLSLDEAMVAVEEQLNNLSAGRK